jgi:tetratricopeptide (TPR) repeat protein
MKRPFFWQVWLLQVRRIMMISCLIQTISAGWPANLLAEETDTFASPEQQMRAGITAYKRGNFEQARHYWNQAASSYAGRGQTHQQIEALLRLAEAQEALGYYQPAVSTLDQALSLADKTADMKRLAQVLGSLGHAYRLLGNAEKAERYTLEGVTRARQQKQAKVLATNLNYLGQVRFHQKRYEEAIKAFSESARLATKHGQGVLAAKAAIDTTWVAVEDKDYEGIARWFPEGLAQTQKLQDSHDKAFMLIALGEQAERAIEIQSEVLHSGLLELQPAIEHCLQQHTPPAYTAFVQLQGEELQRQHAEAAVQALLHAAPIARCLTQSGPESSLAQYLQPSKTEWQHSAHQALNTALTLSERLHNQRAQSYVLGHLGQIYEQAQRVDEALRLTRRAAFIAQAIDAPELLYLWQWQTGRLLKAKRDRAGAIAAYRQSVASLQRIRNDLLATGPRTGQTDFYQGIGRVYFRAGGSATATSGGSSGSSPEPGSSASGAGYRSRPMVSSEPTPATPFS